VGDDPLDDAAAMASLAKGDMNALGVLVRRHQSNVVAFAYRMLGRWDVAEDVAQEAFIRIYRAAPRYQPAAAFTTWLYQIVLNLCRDRKSRERRAPVLPAGTRALENASVDCPEDPIRAHERVQAVRRAVADLPGRQREAVILHRYEGLSHQEVAAVTGWTESAVESLLVRAYATLRATLAHLDQEP
jgi:RNA polymerase sigma-70 factor (ECF subfamily)